MEKRLKNYSCLLEKRLSETLTQSEKAMLMKDLLIQVGFFQHERLIHLLVTLTFAVLTLLTVFIMQSHQSIVLFLLVVLLLALLIPYIRHYFILENGVQKLYRQYDRLADEGKTS